MSTSPFGKGLAIAALSSLWLALSASPVAAQGARAPSTSPQDHQHAPPSTQDTSAQTHDHGGMAQGAMSHAREGSGTAWLPRASPMYVIHRTGRGWEIMLHGNAFLQYLDDGGDRGHHQAGSVNWIMAMA